MKEEEVQNRFQRYWADYSKFLPPQRHQYSVIRIPYELIARDKMTSLSNEEITALLIEDEAFEWSVDYKPFEDNLTPQEYARHGLEVGYKRAGPQEITHDDAVFIREMLVDMLEYINKVGPRDLRGWKEDLPEMISKLPEYES
jgi:hypothetical protein